MFGLTPGDLAEIVEVWECNWTPFSVFEAMSTQWRTGAVGATGLDYNAVPVVMRMLDVPSKKRAEIFHDLRVMEAEALRAMAESKDKK